MKHKVNGRFIHSPKGKWFSRHSFINDGIGIDIDVNILRVTTKIPRNEFDVQLKYWKEAGLKRPSTVRCTKINTIKPGKTMIKVGRLHPEDLIKAQQQLLLYFTKGFESTKPYIESIENETKDNKNKKSESETNEY